MFHISKSILLYWTKDGKPKATITDISRIEMDIGTSLPKPYIEFVTQYGFVIFGEDTEERYHFDYIINFPDRQEIREGSIYFLRQTDRLIKAYHILTTEYPDDDSTPSFPKNYLPVGNDAGQGQILLELGENAGRVWYWPENESAWGTEDNTWLGFVANDFYEFINKLRPPSN